MNLSTWPIISLWMLYSCSINSLLLISWVKVQWVQCLPCTQLNGYQFLAPQTVSKLCQKLSLRVESGVSMNTYCADCVPIYITELISCVFSKNELFAMNCYFITTSFDLFNYFYFHLTITKNLFRCSCFMLENPNFLWCHLYLGFVELF